MALITSTPFFSWGPHLVVAAASTLASSMYTQVDRCPIQRPNGSWEWRYCGPYLDGSNSGWITESGYLDSFTPLQLDVFHALWELYHPPDHRPRSAAKPTSSERFAADRLRALLEAPIGTMVWRNFTDQQGRIQRDRAEVYNDYKTPYWKVRHLDGDWDELTRAEVERGIGTPSASTKSISRVSKAKSRGKG